MKQGRQRKPSVKTVHSDSSSHLVEFWMRCALGIRAQLSLQLNVASRPDRRNENMKYFISSSEDWTPNLSWLQSHASIMYIIIIYLDLFIRKKKTFQIGNYNNNCAICIYMDTPGIKTGLTFGIPKWVLQLLSEQYSTVQLRVNNNNEDIFYYHNDHCLVVVSVPNICSYLL